ELLCQPEKGARASTNVQHTCRSEGRPVRLRRALLQSAATTFDNRLPQPGRVRSGARYTLGRCQARRGNSRFTGHEHLDNLSLVHMNGRVYDPYLGRFLSADPFVPHPQLTQSYNRYSYTRNNPLNLIDP